MITWAHPAGSLPSLPARFSFSRSFLRSELNRTLRTGDKLLIGARGGWSVGWRDGPCRSLIQLQIGPGLRRGRRTQRELTGTDWFHASNASGVKSATDWKQASEGAYHSNSRSATSSCERWGWGGGSSPGFNQKS